MNTKPNGMAGGRTHWCAEMSKMSKYRNNYIIQQLFFVVLVVNVDGTVRLVKNYKCCLRKMLGGLDMCESQSAPFFLLTFQKLLWESTKTYPHLDCRGARKLAKKSKKSKGEKKRKAAASSDEEHDEPDLSDAEAELVATKLMKANRAHKKDKKGKKAKGVITKPSEKGSGDLRRKEWSFTSNL